MSMVCGFRLIPHVREYVIFDLSDVHTLLKSIPKAFGIVNLQTCPYGSLISFMVLYGQTLINRESLHLARPISVY